MTTLDDLLAVNPTTNNGALACLGITRTNEQCGLSASNNSSNGIVRDNNNNNNSRQSEKEKEKEKARRKEREQGAATWKKIQRNVQRSRKIHVADEDLEYLAKLFLCARHHRQSQLQSLVQRIKSDINTHNQKLTAQKTPTAAADMSSPFDFPHGLGAVLDTQRRTQRMVEAAIQASREEGNRLNQMRNQPGASNVSNEQDSRDAEQPPQLVELDLNMTYRPLEPSRVPVTTTVYRQTPQPPSPHSERRMFFRQILESSQACRGPGSRKPIEKGDECSICLEVLGSQRNLVYCRRLCGNNFHRACIRSWLKAIEQSPERPLATCPACRVPWMHEGE